MGWSPCDLAGVQQLLPSVIVQTKPVRQHAHGFKARRGAHAPFKVTYSSNTQPGALREFLLRKRCRFAKSSKGVPER